MLDKRSWQRFTHSPPGQRFQERHERKARAKRGPLARWACVFAGIGLTLVGIFFLAVPGPGIPILAVGLALIAQESGAVARFLDRSELRLRRLWKRLRASYKESGSRTR